MSLGYACITVAVPNTELRTCTLKYATDEKMLEIITSNLNALDKMIDYNIKNNIKLYRITSDLIPFGSTKVNQLRWWDIFATRFKEIGDKIKANNIRVSLHPGQYTVLNSPNEEIVKNSIEELRYHDRILDCLGVNSEHKLILHIGGIYNDKQAAMERFIKNYNLLDAGIKDRLVIENDDRLFTVCDVIQISKLTGAPVVYDNLHNKINPCDNSKTDSYWIKECNKTWRKEDGRQKIHYSQQEPKKQPGSHSSTIRLAEFMDFLAEIDGLDVDIMLEVKDKDLSTIKCLNAIDKIKDFNIIYQEWLKYKYVVLEHSTDDFKLLQQLLKNKKEYPVVEFYTLIEKAFEKEIDKDKELNAALHVFANFKKEVTNEEKASFKKKIQSFKNDKTSIKIVKNELLKLAIKYNKENLVSSYYFYF